MEKQSLIKYYCVLFAVLVLLAGTKNAIAQPANSSPTVKPTIISSPATTQSRENPTAASNNSTLPLIISILALAVSGSAIALTITEIKKNTERISKHDEKHTREINSIKNECTKLLSSQLALQANIPPETSSHNYSDSSNNAYLESNIQSLSVRITELEDKLKATQNNQQSVNYSSPTHLYTQSPNLEADIAPSNQTENLPRPDIIQPPENLAYIELVNIYRNNPKLLEQKAIKVSEDKDSIARRHTDSSQKIVLEKANNSNYWVIHDGCKDCWLLPKNKLRIDQFRYETTKALFECNGYHPEYSTFKLVKPAKVIPLSADEQTWQLEAPGILEFSVED